MSEIRVLLIEDDEDQAILTEDHLLEHPDEFEVDIATSWEECENLDISSYDIVLLDYNLPDVTGLDALKMILERANVPVIFVTGENESETAINALRGGALDYIVKAGDYLRALPVNIKKVIEQFRVKQEKERLEIELIKSFGELKQMQERLIQTEKLSAIGKLVAGVAHEINNPLTGIIGYSQILIQRDPQDRMLKKGLEIIHSEAQRAARIVQNLLQFARKQPQHREYISINKVIEKTVELREYDLKVSDIQVVLDLDPDLPMTMADMQQLQQVFINIINNSQHAILDHGKKPGRLEISTYCEQGEKLFITFTDNGPGIPKEIINNIFDPFFTTKDVGKGTGLGLSICYGIIRDHEGEISIENVPGGGAKVTIELPVLQREGGPAGNGKESEDIEIGSSLNVLVIDDEVSIQDLLVDILSSRGHKVDTASNGQVAIEKIKSRKYDVIISDVKMPGMDGRTFYEYLSRLAPSMTQKIIFITGDTLSERTDEFLSSASVPFLEKPFTVKSVLKAIKGIL